MPKKRNKAPAADSRLFRERLQKCGDRVKTVNQLATDAGIAQSTLSGHIVRGTEPSRPTLLAIAATAKVNLLWLVAGVGPMEGDANGLPTKSDPTLLEIFRRRLDGLATKKGGASQLAAFTGLAPHTLEELRSGREPTATELVILARKCAVSVDYLVGDDINPESLAFASEASQYEGRGTTFATPEHGKGMLVSRDLMANATDLYSHVVSRFAQAKHQWIEMPDDTMEDTFKKGDILIVREQSMISASGVYLIQGPRNRFVTRAIVHQENDSISIYFDNVKYKQASMTTYSADRHICQGRVIAKLTESVS